MRASPEMMPLIQALVLSAGDGASYATFNADLETLLAAIAKLEAARDEATRRLAEEKATVAAQSLDLFGAIDAQDKAERRLAVVEEAVRQAVTDLNFAAATRSIMMVDRAIDDLNAIIHTEKQP